MVPGGDLPVAASDSLLGAAQRPLPHDSPHQGSPPAWDPRLNPQTPAHTPLSKALISPHQVVPLGPAALAQTSPSRRSGGPTDQTDLCSRTCGLRHVSTSGRLKKCPVFSRSLGRKGDQLNTHRVWSKGSPDRKRYPAPTQPTPPGRAPQTSC